MTLEEEIQETREELAHAEQMLYSGWTRGNGSMQTEVNWKQEWRQEVASLKKKLARLTGKIEREL